MSPAKVLLPLTLRSCEKYDIPCVTGIGIPQSEEEWEDSIAIIDGYTGTIYLEPDNEVRKEYEIRRKADLVERESHEAGERQGEIPKRWT